MKKFIVYFVLSSMFLTNVPGAYSESHDKQAVTGVLKDRLDTQTPYVNLNIGIEIAGLEIALEDATTGLDLIGESLKTLAENPELSAEHEKQIEAALSSIDQLGQSLTQVVEQLPSMVEKSIAPVVNVGEELSSQIKRTVITASIALILIIAAALAAVYYFILAPGTRSVIKTANLLDELAKTLKVTAEIVEITSERNLQVIQEVRKVQKQSVDN